MCVRACECVCVYSLKAYYKGCTRCSIALSLVSSLSWGTQTAGAETELWKHSGVCCCFVDCEI